MHVALETGLFRWWPRTGGPAVEISWPSVFLGCEVSLESGEYRVSIVWLRLALGLIGFHIPIGWTARRWSVGDEPQWGLMLSREFGIVVHWGTRRWQCDWPFHGILIDHRFVAADGQWASAHRRWNWRDDAKTEAHPYRYTLRSGEVQERVATIYREQWVRGRHILTWLGLWSPTVEDAIYIDFDGEVGEGTGSWKGGCVGCSYTMLEGETPLDTLRRMERERQFE